MEEKKKMLKPLVISFQRNADEYGWLGNMSPYPVKYEGKIWNTTEALFQGLRFNSEEIREIIRSEPSPMGAKMKTKKYRDSMEVEPRTEGDVENMKLCIKLKLEQHNSLKTKLLNTGTKRIYEDIGKRKGEKHLFWGSKNINGEWVGNNMLGKIWMEMREKLKNNELL